MLIICSVYTVKQFEFFTENYNISGVSSRLRYQTCFLIHFLIDNVLLNDQYLSEVTKLIKISIRWLLFSYKISRTTVYYNTDLSQGTFFQCIELDV